MSKVLINSQGKALMNADGKVYKSTSDELKIARSILDKTITSYSDSELTEIGTYTFYSCKGLTSIDAPNVTTIGQGVFYGCKLLTSVNLPKITIINYNLFYDCYVLPNIHLPLVTLIQPDAFFNCVALTDIYLGANQVVTLVSSSSFTSAGYAQGYINIHVRPEYADQYTDATNWSSLIANGQIVIVGDYSD